MRYIDLDKALAILENSLNWCETQLGDTNKEYKKGCISAIQDDISNISHMKTEDVVPRAEVEQAKQEVAREIFEKIEKLFELYSVPKEYQNLDFVINACRDALKEEYTELKKKYIGE